MKALILSMSIPSALEIILNDVDYISDHRGYILLKKLCLIWCIIFQCCLIHVLVIFFYLLYSQGNYQYKTGTTVVINESVKLLEETRVEVPQPMEQEVATGSYFKWNDFKTVCLKWTFSKFCFHRMLPSVAAAIQTCYTLKHDSTFPLISLNNNLMFLCFVCPLFTSVEM